MTTRFYRRPPAGRALALAALLLALPARGDGLLEHVRGEASSAWLLGSLHFGSPNLYPLDEAVQRAFAASDRMMVEVDLLALDANEVREAVSLHGLYPPGRELSGELTDALWARVSRAAGELGLSTGALGRQRPWLAALSITSAFLERHGLLARYGVDRHFLERARREGVAVAELESFEAQMALLGSLPHEEQKLMLADTLRQVEQDGEMPAALLGAWRTSDRGALDELLIGGLQASAVGRELASRLLRERNAAMATRIAQALRSGDETWFVVVGAGHLLGPHSLGAKLEALGLEVSRADPR